MTDTWKDRENHMVLPEAHGRPEREEQEYEGQSERTLEEKLQHLEEKYTQYEQMFLGEQRRADRLEAELKDMKSRGELELREAERKTAITMTRLEKVTAGLYEALEEFKKEGYNG